MMWDELPELLRRARNGENDAWRALVALAEPFLLSQVGKVMGPHWPQQSASDLTQETWHKAWANLHDFRGGPTAADTAAMFRAWLAKILQSQWKNSVRALLAKKREPPATILPLTTGAAANGNGGHTALDPPDRGPAPSVELRRREQATETAAALDQLENPRDRAVLRLYFYDGRSFREIANELGVTLDKVRTSYHRGLERLQDLKRLQDLMDSLT